MSLSTLHIAEFAAAAEDVTLGFMIECVAIGGPPEAVIDEIVVIDVGIESFGRNFVGSSISISTLFE